MVDISGIGNTTQPRTTGSETGSTSNNLISSDFETFLNMLAAQLKNQDPLNPLQSTDFAVQLATFSSVEQQVLTNDRLETLDKKLLELSRSSAFGIINSQILSEAPFTLSPEGIEFELPEVSGNETLSLVLTNDEGVEMHRETILSQAPTFLFRNDGLVGGQYSASFVMTQANNDEFRTSPARNYQIVEEVRLSNNLPAFLLQGGQLVVSDDVLSVR